MDSISRPTGAGLEELLDRWSESPLILDRDCVATSADQDRRLDPQCLVVDSDGVLIGSPPLNAGQIPLGFDCDFPPARIVDYRWNDLMVDEYSTSFESQGWSVHQWRYADQDVTVLHREPFRLSWVATQLVTFVFIIRRTPEDYQSILDDYSAMRQFAGDHKRTLLPFGFQCGYALLPIYVGQDFSESLIEDVRSTYQTRWCVLHVPSLLESDSGHVHTLEAKSFWGCVYRRFISETIDDVTTTLAAQNAT